MSASLLVLILCLVPPSPVTGVARPSTLQQSAAENRRFFAELELVGPLTELELDCGAAGRTRIVLERKAGEVGRIRVPLPVRAPLGLASLARIPAPEIHVRSHSTADTGVVRWLGFTPEQPLPPPPAIHARPTPPVADGSRTARVHELLFVSAVFALGLGLRRRPRLLVPALIVGSLALAAIARIGPETHPTRSILEIEGETGRAWLVSVARGRILLPDTRQAAGTLEVEPRGTALELSLGVHGDESGDPMREWCEARTPDARLIVREEVRPSAPWNLRSKNTLGDLARAWLRDPAGGWRALGPWPRDEPLSRALPDANEPRASPPGWLSAGLPPGHRVLVGLLAAESGERWIRIAGIAD